MDDNVKNLLGVLTISTDESGDIVFGRCSPEQKWTPEDHLRWQQKNDAIKRRFPDAKFSICVFKTIEEIETKQLTDEDVILYTDNYVVSVLDRETRKWKETENYNDYFIIKKQPGQTHIRYCDVIDTLIANNFDRKTNCNHKFMEDIGRCYKRRNDNSIHVYGSFWGS
jgi:hypothetical protein